MKKKTDRDNQRKRLSRRKRQQRWKVLPGFPWKGTFQTKEAVDAYFAGDTIQCLLCGKQYKQLVHHLLRIHHMTSDAYRERYGLPWSRSLISAPLLQLYRERMLQRIEEGIVPSLSDVEFHRYASARRPLPRPHPPYAIRRSTRKLLEARGRTTPWQPEDYERILQRMQAQQRTLSDVYQDPDLPSLGRWWLFVKQHPEFAEKLQQVYFSLPYSLQLKGRKVSPQFRIDCQRLREQGLSHREIAKTLGVSERTVKRYLRKRR